MRVTKTYSEIQVLGKIWMPNTMAGMEMSLSSFEVENCKDSDENITKESVREWLDSHSGDFSEVIDFAYDLTLGDGNNGWVDYVGGWENEDNEIDFLSCMNPFDDEE